MRERTLLLLLLGLFVTRPLGSEVHAEPVGDEYIAGYSAAVLEREFGVARGSLTIRDGVVSVRADDLAGADRAKVVSVLESIPGVVHVEVEDGGTPRRVARSGGVHDRLAPPEPTFLPKGDLFAPLLADPRWPRFSAAYRSYIGDEELGNVGAANFGETFPLYRDAAPFGGQWEAGIQGGVFSVFDLDADSKDLVNADYFVAAFGGYRTGRLSGLGRVFHQSSHLGDEFLLRSRADRINLSYEAAQLLLSYDILDPVRVYAGGGALFDQEPSDLDPGMAQYGIELHGPWSWAEGAVEPILAADFQHDQESDWSQNASVVGGIQLTSRRMAGMNLQILAEYFNGRSPNGQFYRRRIESAGLGAHLHF